MKKILSKLIIILFVLSFGIAFGYLQISSWAFSGFSWLAILGLPIFAVGCLFPIVCGIIGIIDLVQCTRHKENR